MKKKKAIDWQRYTFEFASIFIAVVLAFALNNWNENFKRDLAESKILTEVYNGIGKDITDLMDNRKGHSRAIRASQYYTKMLSEKEFATDSFLNHYFNLCRDYVSIQNRSGYESLKSKGLELIKNDSLRFKIISLYEYDYEVLLKLEEEYAENQFHSSYFLEINQILAPHYFLDSLQRLEGIRSPIHITEIDKTILASYIWKIQVNRMFLLQFYKDITEKAATVRKAISAEIGLEYVEIKNGNDLNFEKDIRTLDAEDSLTIDNEI